jgi:hypothetical protein
MLRDLTMIISVLVSLVSVGFGVYKNIEAGNAKGFAYQQVYRVLGAVDQSSIPSSVKANITEAALGKLSAPPPVIDLSRSSADSGTVQPACPIVQVARCGTLASDLAAANDACLRSKGVSDDCSRATALKESIVTERCVACFTR